MRAPEPQPSNSASRTLLLVGIILAVALAWGLGALQGREHERRDRAPASYSEAAKADAQRACVGREAAAVFECVYEKVEASQDQARGEQDLGAQQRAASAAMVSAIVAFLTLLISGTALWFLKGTLDATIEAVEDTGRATDAMLEANEIAIASQRPWLTLALEVVGEAKFIEAGLHFDGYIVIKNVGQSAALDVYIKMDIFNQSGPKDGGPQRFVEGCRKGDYGPGFVMAPNEETRHYRGFKLLRDKFPVAIRKSNAVLPLVMVSVTYRRAGGKETLQTAKGFIIEQRARGLGSVGHAAMAFVIDGSPVPEEVLRVRHAAEGVAI